MTGYERIHTAFLRGDLDALQAALGYPPDFPNHQGEPGMAENALEYAIYHSPLFFIRMLLELGADPNYNDGSYPSLLAALSSRRPDRLEIVRLLHTHGANLQQRGINNYTPLHFAANADDPEAIELLLFLGADPDARTNVDDYATPLEEAINLGRLKAVQVLRK